MATCSSISGKRAIWEIASKCIISKNNASGSSPLCPCNRTRQINEGEVLTGTITEDIRLASTQTISGPVILEGKLSVPSNVQVLFGDSPSIDGVGPTSLTITNSSQLNTANWHFEKQTDQITGSVTFKDESESSTTNLGHITVENIGNDTVPSSSLVFDTPGTVNTGDIVVKSNQMDASKSNGGLEVVNSTINTKSLTIEGGSENSILAGIVLSGQNNTTVNIDSGFKITGTSILIDNTGPVTSSTDLTNTIVIGASEFIAQGRLIRKKGSIEGGFIFTNDFSSLNPKIITELDPIELGGLYQNIIMSTIATYVAIFAVNGTPIAVKKADGV